MRTIQPAATTPSVAEPAAAPTTPVDPLIDSIVGELHRMIGSLRCAGTGRMVKAGISMTHLHILWVLDHHGDLTMSRLAEMLDVSFSNATGLIDRMEERGLVERARVPDDRRVVLVRPAAGGRLALEEAELIKREQLRTVLGTLDRAQLERAMATFRDVRLAMEAAYGGSAHLHHFVDRAD